MLTIVEVRGFQPDPRGPSTERIVLVNRDEELRFYVSVPHGSEIQTWLHAKSEEKISLDYVYPSAKTNPAFTYFLAQLAKGPDFDPVLSQKKAAFPDGPQGNSGPASSVLADRLRIYAKHLKSPPPKRKGEISLGRLFEMGTRWQSSASSDFLTALLDGNETNLRQHCWPELSQELGLNSTAA